MITKIDTPSEYEQLLDHVDLFGKTFESKNDPSLRLALVTEESAELWKAIVKEKSPEEIEGEFGDLLYVVFGWGLLQGINPYRAIENVMAKNQKKIDNRANYRISAAGKVLKPDDE
jgi:NTP pyrophosphatase (non-canonical NTP hydrolase)